MSKRVLIAGLFHETHTFLEDSTPLAAFQQRTGNELLAAQGDGSPLAGAIEVAMECGWDLIPTIDMRATPSGLVEDDVLEHFWANVVSHADQQTSSGQQLDGIYLVLHGAMACTSTPDVEGELVRRTRKHFGEHIPICGVLDLHGNISRDHIETTQGFSAYRCNPHTDANEAAVRGARLLDKIMATRIWPQCVWEQPDVMWPPTGTGTDDVAMKTLEQMARAMEAEHDIEMINVFAGFSFADTRNTGVSFNAVTFGEADVARSALRQLSDWATSNRQLGNIVEPKLNDVRADIHNAIQATLEEPSAGPVVIVEPSDNIGGGAPGDTTELLQFLLDEQFPNSAIVINDSQVVASLRENALGDTVSIRLGAKGSRAFCDPIDVRATLVNKTGGRFELEDRNSHLASMAGVHIDMGNSVVLRTDKVTILITSKKTPPFDLGQLRSQGIDPESCSVIVVKAAVAHRRAYDPITSASFTINTSGPCSSDLRSFAFKNVRRPVFPLDE